MLPPELLLQIFSYLNPLDLFSLKLAGSRYIADYIRSLPQLPFSKYIEMVGVKDDPKPALFIAAAIGHESLLRALFERAIHSDLPMKQPTRFGRRKLVQETWKADL